MQVNFNTKDVVVYIAGAGSGKTTALMNNLTRMLRKYRPEEIAFTTFTRKGVLTGIERALQANKNIKIESLVYFQTLHKMCFKESGLSRANILDRQDILRFNRLLGFNLQTTQAFNNQTEDDKLLQRYNALRSNATTGIYVHSFYDEEKYERFVLAYEQFKKENALVDFYDCLLFYKKTGRALPITAFFLDEAQDITPLQWEVIMLAAKNAVKVRISGDPAQTIFSYQGADPKILLDLANKYKTVELNNTYRLPKQLCTVADSIVDLMQEKRPRKHMPVKIDSGGIQEISDRSVLVRLIKQDFEMFGYQPYRWFLLFRCNYHITAMTELLEHACIPYHTSNGFVLGKTELNKIVRYKNYQLDGYGDPDVKERFKHANHITDFSKDFMESNLIPTERRYVYGDYIEKFGLDAMLKMVDETPFCFVATTYKVKGGEADNVAVFLDATRQVHENLLVDLDGELRVFYVACTRAKEKLFVVKPESRYNLTSLWEATVENLQLVTK